MSRSKVEAATGEVALSGCFRRVPHIFQSSLRARFHNRSLIARCRGTIASCAGATAPRCGRDSAPSLDASANRHTDAPSRADTIGAQAPPRAPHGPALRPGKPIPIGFSSVSRFRRPPVARGPMWPFHAEGDSRTGRLPPDRRRLALHLMPLRTSIAPQQVRHDTVRFAISRAARAAVL